MSFANIAAIVRADFLIRFRRVSTVVVFLLLSALAYVWVPDPATGRALMQVRDQRALYNSAAIAVGTAGLATIFIGLAGFYVISNAIQHDLRSRCGSIIASTPVGSTEYLLGKFLGNVVFLSTFVGGYMVTAMAMLLVRAEAPLQPLVFVKQYVLLMPPVIVFVSAIAVAFESIPWLSGRIGDVVYFFLFVGSLGAVASNIESAGGPTLAAYFDYSSFGYLITNIKQVTGSSNISLGASNFEASKGLFVYSGLTLTNGWLLPRLGATLMPLSLLALARLFFHRFDPARVKSVAQKSGRSWLGRLNAVSRPLSRLFLATVGRLLSIPTPFALFNAARADALASIAAFPLSVVAILGFAIAALVADPQSLFRGVLPIAFAALAIVLADIASREKRSGTTAFVYAAPRLRGGFVAWKLASALLVSILFLAVPLTRALMIRPAMALPLAAGLLFLSAAATALGIVSANPKTFIVAFLSFWYVVINDRGLSPEFDFAGFYGVATPPVIATYTALALGLLTIAQLFHRSELRRRW